jgi:hypothetical protein
LHEVSFQDDEPLREKVLAARNAMQVLHVCLN